MILGAGRVSVGYSLTLMRARRPRWRFVGWGISPLAASVWLGPAWLTYWRQGPRGDIVPPQHR